MVVQKRYRRDPLYVPSEVDHLAPGVRDLVDDRVSVVDMVSVAHGLVVGQAVLGQLVVVEEEVDLVAFPAESQYLLVFVLVLGQILLLLPD